MIIIDEIDKYAHILIKHMHEDEQFGLRFCDGCKGNRYDPGDENSPSEWYCHCDYDMLDSRCLRRKEWEKIENLAVEIVEIVDEGSNEEWAI